MKIFNLKGCFVKLISTLLTFLFLSSLAYGSQNYEDFTLKDYEYSWCGKIIYRGDGTYLSFERDEKVDLRLSSDFYSGLKDDELKAIKKLIKDRSLDDITLCLSLTATSYLNDSAGRYGGEYPEVAQIKGSPKFVKVIEKEKTLYNGKLSQLARMATEPYVFVRINYRGRNEAQEVDLAKYGWAYDDSREKWSLDGSTIIFLDETKLNGAFPVKSTAYGYNFEFYYNNRRSEATLRIEVKRTTQ
ncbi:MAG: hypothetical protein KDD50_01760, partial [Bdellovibrionales bacterium]|nr:hypothetical protein [Bdellovibrionales bacterium]